MVFNKEEIKLKTKQNKTKKQKKNTFVHLNKKERSFIKNSFPTAAQLPSRTLWAILINSKFS